MKVSTAIETLQKLDPNQEIFFYYFDKSDFEDYYGNEEPVSDEVWSLFLNHMDRADYYWENQHYALCEEVDNWKEKQEEKEKENE